MAAVLIFLVACGDAQRKDTSAEKVHVKLQQIEMQEYQKPVRTSGKVASKKEVKLSFKTGGIIDEIKVGEGMEVQKDALMAALQRDEIEAGMDQARLALEKAERDLQRVENLYMDSVATLEQLQNARTAAAAAKSNLEIAQFNYRHSVIRAPADGRILKKIAGEAEIVGPGHPVFLFASTGSGWIVEGSLSDREVTRLSLNDSVAIRLDAYPDKPVTGIVSELGQYADPYTGTFDVKVRIATPHPHMVTGFVARMLIFPAEKEKALMVPVEALVDAEKYNGFVYRFIDGKAIRTRLKLGDIINGKVLVREGLQADDLIVCEGVNYIDETKEIVVENEEAWQK